MRQSTFLTAAVLTLSIAVAGCAGSQVAQGNPSPAGAPEQRAAALDQPAGAPEQPAAGFTLATAENGELGEIITDGAGMTLYRFDADTAKPPTSTCDGDCVVAWPPAIVSGTDDLQLGSIAAELIGTLRRADGSDQLTVAGWPAYYYSKDTAPGDIKGHGAGGQWFAFTPEGKKAQVPSAGPQATEQLVVMNIASLGPVLTDRQGMTLYRFDRDSADPSKSVCVDQCAETWPPVVVPEGTAVTIEGAGGEVGTVVRPDGLTQVTVGGWPLYRFSGDKVPCDINGHGVGGTWFAADPNGGKAG